MKKKTYQSIADTLQKYENIYKAMLANSAYMNSNTIGASTDASDTTVTDLQDLLRSITTAQQASSDVSASNIYVGDSLTGDGSSISNWISTASPFYNYSYSNALRTIIDIDTLSIRDNGVTTEFKVWLQEFIKQTLEKDLLELKEGEIAALKAEIANLHKLLEDVFQEAALTKLERLAKEDNQ